MNALIYSINRILRVIPKDILHLAFMRKVESYNIPKMRTTTLQQQIQELVLDNIVLVDINLISGMSLSIPIDKCHMYEYEHDSGSRNIVIRVPFNLTNDKRISAVYNLTTNGSNVDSKISKGDYITGQIGEQLAKTTRSSPGMVYTGLEIISSNTILVHDDISIISNGFLNVTVENNRNLSNFKPRSQIQFAKMVVLAAKMFIYNTLILELDKGALYHGHELNRISEIIDKYESAEEEYNTFLETKWPKISFVNDDIAMSSYIKLIAGPLQ